MRPRVLLWALPALLVLTGCASDRTVAERLGLGRNVPDEFQVMERAPLVVPPEYGLRPPEPGAVRPQEGTASQRAQEALTGSLPEARPTTPGTDALLAAAGTSSADPDIREVLIDESEGLAGLDEDRFWFILDFQRRAYARGDATPLDARSEANRLAAAGIDVRSTRLGSQPILPPEAAE